MTTPHQASAPHDNPPVPNDRRHLLGCTPDELRTWLVDHNQARFRANQVLDWIYQKRAADFAAMTNLSKDLRAWLEANALLYSARIIRETVAADATRKLLLQLADGATTETVWIPTAERHTACLSTQVGCPVGCRFCASGLDGLERNLTTGEIVEQALHISRLIAEQATADDTESTRLSNLVIMGMGEPLANYRNLVPALRILNARWGLGIGARKITVSTVGLPKPIRALAHEDLQLSLALSLHAPDDDLRQRLIPWARGVKLREIIDACLYYFRTTGREITLEYILLKNVNMYPTQADELAEIARKLRANVNLLRYNPVAGLDFVRPTGEEAFEFQRRLRARGANAHIRTSRGSDANAACGQLRRAAKGD